MDLAISLSLNRYLTTPEQMLNSGWKLEGTIPEQFSRLDNYFAIPR